jgi:hypothetical protein
MQELRRTITPPRSEQAFDPTHLSRTNVVSAWARGRRKVTPWAYPRLRALAAVRFIVGIFLAIIGGLALSRGYPGPAALALAGAALHFGIAYLDISAARSVRRGA